MLVDNKPEIPAIKDEVGNGTVAMDGVTPIAQKKKKRKSMINGEEQVVQQGEGEGEGTEKKKKKRKV